MKATLKIALATVVILILTSGKTNAQLNKYFFFNQARTLISNENYSQAIQSLNTLIRTDSTIAEAWFLRGIAKYNLSDLVGAQNDFTKAIKFNPVFSQAYLYRGIVYSNLSKHQLALKDFEAMIDLRPNSPDGYYSRGLTYLLTNQTDKSIADFNKVIQFQPKNIDAWLNRGSAKLYGGDTLSALADYSKATILNPFYAESFSKRGRLYYQLKKHNLAVDDLNQAIYLDSTSSVSYFFRALTHSELNQTQLALADINKAIEISPNNALSIYNRAIIYWNAKELKLALSDFDRVIKLNPENLLVYYNKAILQTGLKEYSKAIDNFSKAIDLFPDFANAYIGRANAYVRTGNFHQAQKDRNFAESIAQLYSNGHVNPLTDTTSNLSNLIAFSSDFTPRTSIPFFDEYETKPVDILPFFRVIATDSSKQNLFTQGFLAIDTINTRLKDKNIMLRLSSDNTFVYSDSLDIDDYWLSQLLKAIDLAAQKRYNEAIDIYQNLEDDYPNNPITLNNKAVARAQMVNFIASFNNDIAPLSFNSSTKSNSYELSKQQSTDDYSDAILILENLVKEYPYYPYFTYNLGNLYTHTHQFDKAIETYTLAIELNPNIPEAWYNRGLIRLMQKENELACYDLGKAGEMGIRQAYLLIHRFCKGQ
ncbi:MAG TPA: tetratricopeptide repeat protein [Tenuifilaceae bacterium]|nr:tetratricopeptide repeat protein [Tenuifilaceae bacterium]